MKAVESSEIRLGSLEHRIASALTPSHLCHITIYYCRQSAITASMLKSEFVSK